MSRCPFPCSHCGHSSLGPIEAARRCLNCGAWTRSVRKPQLKDRVAPVDEWRATAEQFVRNLDAEDQRLRVDLRRARERHSAMVEDLTAWRTRWKELRADLALLLVVMAGGHVTHTARVTAQGTRE